MSSVSAPSDPVPEDPPASEARLAALTDPPEPLTGRVDDGVVTLTGALHARPVLAWGDFVRARRITRLLVGFDHVRPLVHRVHGG